MDRDWYPDDNKHWAKEYLLDPLNGPTPSDECGPGSSFITPNGVARQLSVKNKESQQTRNNSSNKHSKAQSTTKKESADRSNKPLPRLPTATETPPRTNRRPGLPPSIPTSPPSLSRRTTNEQGSNEEAPLLRKLVSRTQSVRELLTGPSHPGRYPPPAGLSRSKTVHTYQPVETDWNRGTILTRSNSVAATGDSTKDWATPAARKPGTGTIRSKRRPSVGGLARSKTVITTATRPREQFNRGATFTRSASVRTTGRPPTPAIGHGFRSSPATSPISSPVESPRRYQLEDVPMASPPLSSNNPFKAKTEADKGKGIGRSGSLSARFPGDMSHRPLEILRREHRAADRNPYNYSAKHRHVRQPSDPIDVLDKSGVVGTPYHHDGPYDPTLADRNTNNLYPPIEAVKGSNEEALKATPRENIQDSLDKHVPLQGTAIIPPGMRDMSGRTMEYEEGADLMRERSADGGAYKRYDFISYRDDDFKGKGEPSFTYEKDLHDRKRTTGDDTTVMYEMQSGVNSTSPRDKSSGHVRQRSISNADKNMPAVSGSHRGSSSEVEASGSGVSRRNTTGKSKLDGLKRRIGSLRKKKTGDDDYL